MRIKSLFVLLLLTQSLFSAPQASQEVELLARHVTKEGTIAHAKDDVVLHTPQYLITADEALYDYASGDVELFGKITILEGSTYASRSGYTKLNLNSDQGFSKGFFMVDHATQIWLKCDEAKLSPTAYITQKAIVSSCNTQDPDWKIEFSEGEYHKENQWMHLYHPRFYVGDVPVLYLPYFAFSTDTTRRTGLLRPELGLGSEGLFYLQPIYFAPQPNWDVELSPQIRTSRGEGLHVKGRFIDSRYSYGEISTGLFREHDDYVEDKNLKHQEHYGFKVQYERSALLSEHYAGMEDGMWVDLNYLNDIDYYNTLSNETRSYDKLVVSRFNYYATQGLNYAGLYAKYYIDTSKISNDDTLQELPTLHYHRFSNPVLLDNLYYSVDYKAKNYSRQKETTAMHHELNAPVTLHLPLWDDFVHFTFSENVYLSQVGYDDATTPLENGEYWRNYHTFGLYTELAKAYDTFFHTIYLGIEHTVPSKEKREGDWEDFIALNTLEKSTALSLKEFFYDQNAQAKVSHKLRQLYYYSDERYAYGDLENELRYHVSKELSIGHTLSYSHEYKTLSRNQLSLRYEDAQYTTALRYTYEDSVYEKSVEQKDYNYVTFEAQSRAIPLYSLFASVDYDLDENNFKAWSLGWKKKSKCWDYTLRYRDVKIPKLTSASIDSINRKGLLLEFNFYPIGNIGHEFASETEQKL